MHSTKCTSLRVQDAILQTKVRSSRASGTVTHLRSQPPCSNVRGRKQRTRKVLADTLSPAVTSHGGLHGSSKRPVVTRTASSSSAALRAQDQLQHNACESNVPEQLLAVLWNHMFRCRAVWLAAACILFTTFGANAAIAASSSTSSDSILKVALSWILHLDKHMAVIISKYGAWTYAVLFGIVFCETGLVVTPFLPGDSLLFAAGTFCALGHLSLWYVVATFFVAAVLGDTVNYALGSWLGAKVFTEDSKIFRKSYLKKTENFYSKYGGKTVVLARFVPIVRTFAPFVAGVSNMAYPKYVFYNVAGAVIWTVLFTCTGYFFGTLPFVQNNFTVVVLAIVAISVLPVVYEILAAKKEEGETPKTGSSGALLLLVACGLACSMAGPALACAVADTGAESSTGLLSQLCAGVLSFWQLIISGLVDTVNGTSLFLESQCASLLPAFMASPISAGVRMVAAVLLMKPFTVPAAGVLTISKVLCSEIGLPEMLAAPTLLLMETLCAVAYIAPMVLLIFVAVFFYELHLLRNKFVNKAPESASGPETVLVSEEPMAVAASAAPSPVQDPEYVLEERRRPSAPSPTTGEYLAVELTTSKETVGKSTIAARKVDKENGNGSGELESAVEPAVESAAVSAMEPVVESTVEPATVRRGARPVGRQVEAAVESARGVKEEVESARGVKEEVEGVAGEEEDGPKSNVPELSDVKTEDVRDGSSSADSLQFPSISDLVKKQKAEEPATTLQAPESAVDSMQEAGSAAQPAVAGAAFSAPSGWEASSGPEEVQQEEPEVQEVQEEQEEDWMEEAERELKEYEEKGIRTSRRSGLEANAALINTLELGALLVKAAPALMAKGGDKVKEIWERPGPYSEYYVKEMPGDPQDSEP
ncbi:hypothetical protein CYMTET_51660 [Cymbomonas tetramitiformis]|uniref:VTT domain-containing protein n=1 Tax=Cymbomonas tetramitiformis TaxID=36881 RepID=A0AAE0BKK0_9CHLO|nr:hypothetical protein CYMTET_51660 [Cymbomonas tetramitiformis]